LHRYTRDIRVASAVGGREVQWDTKTVVKFSGGKQASKKAIDVSLTNIFTKAHKHPSVALHMKNVNDRNRGPFLYRWYSINEVRIERTIPVQTKDGIVKTSTPAQDFSVWKSSETEDLLRPVNKCCICPSERWHAGRLANKRRATKEGQSASNGKRSPIREGRKVPVNDRSHVLNLRTGLKHRKRCDKR
jgi:hypothetical protein